MFRQLAIFIVILILSYDDLVYLICRIYCIITLLHVLVMILMVCNSLIFGMVARMGLSGWVEYLRIFIRLFLCRYEATYLNVIFISVS